MVHRQTWTHVDVLYHLKTLVPQNCQHKQLRQSWDLKILDVNICLALRRTVCLKCHFSSNAWEFSPIWSYVSFQVNQSFTTCWFKLSWLQYSWCGHLFILLTNKLQFFDLLPLGFCIFATLHDLGLGTFSVIRSENKCIQMIAKINNQCKLSILSNCRLLTPTQWHWNQFRPNWRMLLLRFVP